MSTLQHISLTSSLTAIAAACVLAGCGGGDSSSSSTTPTPTPAPTAAMLHGVVNSSLLVSGSATTPTIQAGYYQGATVCYDSNNNGICDASENPVTTDSTGHFALPMAGMGAIIADVSATAVNTANSKATGSHIILRASAAQVTEQSTGTVVVSPMSSEIQRMVEANSTDYQTEKANLATRVGVTAAQLLSDVTTVTGTAQTALLQEANALYNRFAYATKKFDSKELYPDALAVAGGDPELTGLAHVTPATATTADTRTPITFLQAQQAAFNVEGIPRYDSVFIVMLENKGTTTILGSAYAPKINAYLQAGNQFTSYFATGNPSEPNYTALGGADDFGISDDSQWNCDATGANAVQDLPLPDNTQPGLASSPFTTTCTQTAAVNHNIVGKPNLFNALTAKGLQWRTYSESMNPGQDFRTDGVADAAVTATDNVYAPGTLGGNATQIGTPGLVLPMPAGLYKTKHHPGMAYQNVRSAPEWKFSNRTLGGGQWDANLLNGKKYAVPANYVVDQFGADLQSGAVGQINFIMPDQCDDMHSISVPGTPSGTASDCSSGNNIITRGDNYVDALVKKIQASPLWANRQKRVAIVLMFDEGTATSGFNSCCGWNVSNSTVATPLKQNADGTWSQDTSVNNYAKGNRGHGESIFAVLTNQPNAPKGIKDSDPYSHFSFVRTLQDMFQLADPANDASYMNRSKYTEKFIANNILNLPEYAGSADTHFDSVRPMNHAYVIPATYTQKQSSDTQTLTPQVGPDATQAGVWAVK
ncbi:alkaline phosphatase family protein [Silvimonas sp.]|uniref:alkaline phosphatase family protein n=1 Tax=Silvimonas sp. TaxID=2650811 RepID=UPI0028509FFB|nr:alkaline phosphatase family protein [Silvimonas sp.]MDR3428144.1 alkaline phosphatase family protein [Silvimonas sp.]